jgi:hypothetical protein
MAAGKEPGTIPATRTPTTTTEISITTMRARLQMLDTASERTLRRNLDQHTKMLGDLLTTMRVQFQGVKSPSTTSWLISADSVEDDLDRLDNAKGDAIRTGFQLHRKRVLRLLDEFRVLVPKKEP